MKKRFLFLCCLCLSVVWVGCEKNDSLDDVDGNEVQETARDLMEVREAAWDFLGAKTQETVTHSWEDAMVGMVGFDFFDFSDENFPYEKYAYCYQVTFNTKADLLHPIRIYLDFTDLEYLGRSESNVTTFPDFDKTSP